MKRKKILITGASSIIGEAVNRIISSEIDADIILITNASNDTVFRSWLRYYQISALNKQSTKAICLEERPDVIINTIGLSDIEKCESNKRLAWELNTHIVENLTRISKIIDAHFITISSEHIFDGSKGLYSEDDKPNPINYFGKSKHAAENICRTQWNRFTILRTTLLYGYSSFKKIDFVEKIKNSVKNGFFFASSEIYTNPVYADDLASIVCKVIDKEKYGIYNVGGADWLNQLQIARTVAEIFKLDMNKIIEAELPAKNNVKIPKKAGLLTLKTEFDLGFKFCTLQSGLESLKFRQSDSKLEWEI